MAKRENLDKYTRETRQLETKAYDSLADSVIRGFREQRRLAHESTLPKLATAPAKSRVDWAAVDSPTTTSRQALDIGDSEAHRGYLIKKGFGEQYHVSSGGAHIYTAQSLEHAKSEIDKLVGESGKGSKRQALVEEHRASEHLFKPAPTSDTHERAQQAGRQVKALEGELERTRADHHAGKATLDEVHNVERSLSKAHEAHAEAKVEHEHATRERSHAEVKARGERAMRDVLKGEREQRPLKDPHKEQMARLQQAKNVQTGKRGGRFYLLPGGGKSYVRD